jgi:hypothetical protein
VTRSGHAAVPRAGYTDLAMPAGRILPHRSTALGCDMSHLEMLAALDHHLDALVAGTGNLVDLTDGSPDALELQQLLTTAWMTIQVLDEPLCPTTQARHLRMLKAAAASRDCTPRTDRA